MDASTSIYPPSKVLSKSSGKKDSDLKLSGKSVDEIDAIIATSNAPKKVDSATKESKIEEIGTNSSRRNQENQQEDLTGLDPGLSAKLAALSIYPQQQLARADPVVVTLQGQQEKNSDKGGKRQPQAAPRQEHHPLDQEGIAWTPRSFDSQYSETIYPSSTVTSELGQAILEGDIQAAIDCFKDGLIIDDKTNKVIGEEELTVNSLLQSDTEIDEGSIPGDSGKSESVEVTQTQYHSSDSSFLLDPEEYAFLFEDVDEEEESGGVQIKEVPTLDTATVTTLTTDQLLVQDLIESNPDCVPNKIETIEQVHEEEEYKETNSPLPDTNNKRNGGKDAATLLKLEETGGKVIEVPTLDKETLRALASEQLVQNLLESNPHCVPCGPSEAVEKVDKEETNKETIFPLPELGKNTNGKDAARLLKLGEKSSEQIKEVPILDTSAVRALASDQLVQDLIDSNPDCVPYDSEDFEEEVDLEDGIEELISSLPDLEINTNGKDAARLLKLEEISSEQIKEAPILNTTARTLASFQVVQNLIDSNPYCVPCDSEDIKEAEIADAATTLEFIESTFNTQRIKEASTLDTASTTPIAADLQEVQNPALDSPYCLPCKSEAEEIVDLAAAVIANTEAEQDQFIVSSEDLESDLFDDEFFATLMEFSEEEDQSDKMDPNYDNNQQQLAAIGEEGNDKAETNNSDSQTHHLQQQSNEQYYNYQDQQAYDAQYYSPPPQSIRTKAQDLSQPLIDSFAKKNGGRPCYGHKEIIYCLSFSSCGRFLATVSQDSSIKVWNADKKKLMATLNGHGKDYECLRIAWASPKWTKKLSHSGIDDDIDQNEEMILASGGADGLVMIWKSIDGGYEWKRCITLNHTSQANSKIVTVEGQTNMDDDEKEEDAKKEDNVPQIYAVQFIDNWKGLPYQGAFHTCDEAENERLEAENVNHSATVLMTSSDDYIHLWQAVALPTSSDEENKASNFSMEKLMSFRFTHLENGGGGVLVYLEGEDENQGNTNTVISSKTAFGGVRNPENLVYVFDAVQCPANNLLGVALSDGTLRLVNGRGVCVSILQLPGCESHLTSFGWSKYGSRLASCVASGHLILWDIDFGNGRGGVYPSCRAVLEGGHDEGRPLYGSTFCGGNTEDLILSWGVDGKLCVWDSYSEGQVESPISVLVSNKEYPLYAAGVREANVDTGDESDTAISQICIAGGKEGGFIGIPVFLYDIRKGDSK